MSPEKKLRIAKALERAGTDVIEAGFPANSQAERESIKMISREVEASEVAVLCRPMKADIDAASETVSRASRSRVHLWIATSPLHMRYKLNMPPQKVMERVVEGVRYAQGKFDVVQFTAEDATRSEIEFLCDLMREAVRAGAHEVNLADTLGCALPEQVSLLVQEVRRSIGDRVPVGVHCHNDLGLATANCLSAIRSGARHIDVTVTGIGERSGNASYEQVVVSLLFHKDHFDIDLSVDPSKLGELCDTVIKEMGLLQPLCQPLIGQNAFKHESGIHVHGMLSNPMTYELLNPSTIGIKGEQYVLGKHTGKAAVRHFLEKKGCTLPDDELMRLTDLVKESSLLSGPIDDPGALVKFAQDKGFDLKAREGPHGN
ncbi:MAG: hypothetical protein MUC62_03350 [Candidatus Thermoplasmatota archaeon]|nr:hypothetical protein [Candidatus Thermoplasmatota archaeon]